MRVPVDRSVVDMLETNNVERFRARRNAAVRKAGLRGKRGTSMTTPTAPRSLPSGPAAPSIGGIALSVLLMGVGVVALGVALAGYGVIWTFETVTGRGRK